MSARFVYARCTALLLWPSASWANRFGYGINPQEYLTDVRERLTTVTNSQVRELLPATGSLVTFDQQREVKPGSTELRGPPTLYLSERLRKNSYEFKQQEPGESAFARKLRPGRQIEAGGGGGNAWRDASRTRRRDACATIEIQRGGGDGRHPTCSNGCCRNNRKHAAAEPRLGRRTRPTSCRREEFGL